MILTVRLGNSRPLSGIRSTAAVKTTIVVLYYGSGRNRVEAGGADAAAQDAEADDDAYDDDEHNPDGGRPGRGRGVVAGEEVVDGRHCCRFGTGI